SAQSRSYVWSYLMPRHQRDENNLTPKMRRFVDALLENGGNRTAAAKAAGYGPNSRRSAAVSGHVLMKHQAGRRVLTEHTQQILAEAAPKAAMRLQKLIDHKSGYVALEASKDVLNRNGMGAGERSSSGPSVTVNISLYAPQELGAFSLDSDAC